MAHYSIREKLSKASDIVTSLLDLPSIKLHYTASHDSKNSFIQGSKAALKLESDRLRISCTRNASIRTLSHEVTHALHITHNQSVNTLCYNAVLSFAAVRATPTYDSAFIRHYKNWIKTRSRAIICAESVGYAFDAWYGDSQECAQFTFTDQGPILPPNPRKESSITTSEINRYAQGGLQGLDMLCAQTFTYAYMIGKNYGHWAKFDMTQPPRIELYQDPAVPQITISLKYPTKKRTLIRDELRRRVRLPADELIDEALTETSRQLKIVRNLKLKN